MFGDCRNVESKVQYLVFSVQWVGDSGHDWLMCSIFARHRKGEKGLGLQTWDFYERSGLQYALFQPRVGSGVQGVEFGAGNLRVIGGSHRLHHRRGRHRPVLQMIDSGCGLTRREDALIWDRPRVVYHRICFSIRRLIRALQF